MPVSSRSTLLLSGTVVGPKCRQTKVGKHYQLPTARCTKRAGVFKGLTTRIVVWIRRPTHAGNHREPQELSTTSKTEASCSSMFMSWRLDTETLCPGFKLL